MYIVFFKRLGGHDFHNYFNQIHPFQNTMQTLKQSYNIFGEVFYFFWTTFCGIVYHYPLIGRSNLYAWINHSLSSLRAAVISWRLSL